MKNRLTSQTTATTMNESPNDTTGNVANDVEERERETPISLLPERRTYTLYCQYTGVEIATLDMLMQVGKLPYLANWHDSVATHPLFSLSQRQLLAWTRKNWNILFRNTTDRSTPTERLQFQIAFVAILHSMGGVKIEHPTLPSFDIVNANMQRLLELAYWHNYLDSKRFTFPTYRINKNNNNTNLSDIATYLAVCESRKRDWETSKDAKAETAKLIAAERAEKSVRGSHIRAISKRALWNWFMASIMSSNSKKYQLPEWKEWKEDSEKLWFANENQQLQFSLDDVDAIEDVLLTECEIGNTVSNAFKRELNTIREHIRNHLMVFEIDLSTIPTPVVRRVDAEGNPLGSSNVEEVVPEDPGSEPQLGQFHSRSDYTRAHAKWKINSMRYAAWKEKQPNTGESNDN